MNNKAYKPPSRIRYEQENPTVSVRVTRELYDQLLEFRQKTGESLGDILREALHIQQELYKQAYNKGYNDARKKYRVIYRCNKCKKIIPVTSDNAKSAIAKYMAANGWGHTHCPTGSKI